MNLIELAASIYSIQAKAVQPDWFLTAETRIQCRVNSSEIRDELEQVFLRALGFILLIIISSLLMLIILIYHWLTRCAIALTKQHIIIPSVLS
jgi:hypothetical protein